MLTFARGIQDAFLRDEAQLYVAQALVYQNVLHEALSTLAPLPQKLEPGGRFEAEVAYWRGRAYEELGADEEALRQFQHAFRCWPALYDVAERAQARQLEPMVAAAQAPDAESPSTSTSESGLTDQDA